MEQTRKKILLIWIAHLLSYISYGGVIYVFSLNQSLLVTPEMAEFSQAFLAMAILFPGASFFIREPVKQMLKKKRTEVATADQKILHAHVFTLMPISAGSLMSLLYYIFTAKLMISYILLAFCALVLLLHFPSEEGYEKLRKFFYDDHSLHG